MAIFKHYTSFFMLALVAASAVSSLSLQKIEDDSSLIRLSTLDPPTKMLMHRRLQETEDGEEEEVPEGDDATEGGDAAQGDDAAEGDDDDNSVLDDAVDTARDAFDTGSEKAQQGYNWWREQSTGVKVAVIIACLVALSALVGIVSCLCGCL